MKRKTLIPCLALPSIAIAEKPNILWIVTDDHRPDSVAAYNRLGSMELNINPTAPLDAYAVSKAALNMVTVRLANHLKARRITVVAISPRWVKTDMGGDHADLEIDEAIRQVTDTIGSLGQNQTGCFVSSQGLPERIDSEIEKHVNP